MTSPPTCVTCDARHRTGFESGEVSFLAVVEAEKNLRSVELAYEEALTDRHRRRADLERALGRLPGSYLGPDAEEGHPLLSRSPRTPEPDGLAAETAGGAR